MTIDQFETEVKALAGSKHWAACREDYRNRGRRVVSWSAYIDGLGWAGLGRTANNPNDVLAELRRLVEGRYVA
jgi:hypothetical protein